MRFYSIFTRSKFKLLKVSWDKFPKFHTFILFFLVASPSPKLPTMVIFYQELLLLSFHEPISVCKEAATLLLYQKLSSTASSPMWSSPVTVYKNIALCFAVLSLQQNLSIDVRKSFFQTFSFSTYL